MPYLNLDQALAAAAPVITAGAPLVSTDKTLLDLRRELKLSLGNRGDYDEILDGSRWINDAYLLITSGIKFEETKFGFVFPTVANQPFYLMPAAIQYATQISLADTADYPVHGGTPLERITDQIYRQLPDTDRLGIPRAFFRFGRMLVIWPTPLAVYQLAVEGRVRPLKLVNDTDSPILPPEWHRALMVKAKSFAKEDLEEDDGAEKSQNSYVRMVREMGSPEAEEQNADYATIRPVRRARDLPRTRRAIEPGEGGL